MKLPELPPCRDLPFQPPQNNLNYFEQPGIHVLYPLQVFLQITDI
jgi:hypothetical protein